MALIEGKEVIEKFFGFFFSLFKLKYIQTVTRRIVNFTLACYSTITIIKKALLLYISSSFRFFLGSS